MNSGKKIAIDAIEEKAQLCCEVSDKIWGYAELSLQEYQSAALYVEELKKLGFEVEAGFDGIQTAFTAKYGHGKPVIGILGGGLMASVNSSWKSSFFAVTSLKARRRYNAIYLNEPGCKNIIYVDDRDFDFVWSYIKARCDKAKTNEGEAQ